MQLEETDELDTFVELELHDPEKADVESQRSSVIMNEDNPRWGEKFDFVMVSATSALDLTVYDKQGFFDNLLSVKALTGNLSIQAGQGLADLCQTGLCYSLRAKQVHKRLPALSLTDSRTKRCLAGC